MVVKQEVYEWVQNEKKQSPFRHQPYAHIQTHQNICMKLMHFIFITSQ